MTDAVRFLVVLGVILGGALVFAVWYDSRDVLDARIGDIDHQLDGIKADRKLDEAPQVAPETTAASAPVALTVPSNTEGESVVQKLASKVGLGSDRDEIIEFTREALGIEAERNRGMEMSLLEDRLGYWGAARIIRLTFLGGMDRAQSPEGFVGMYFLRSRLLLLDAPHTLQSIKDSLAQAYASEIQLAINQLQLQRTEAAIDAAVYDAVNNFHSTVGYYKKQYSPTMYVIPQITKGNVDARQASLKPGRSLEGWGQTQLFRKQIYTRWSEILQEQGIDPAEEGFTELVPGPATPRQP